MTGVGHRSPKNNLPNNLRENGTQIPARKIPGNLPVAKMEAEFKEGGNPDVTARVLPDLNHIFVHDTDGFPQNYAKLPPPVMMEGGAVEIIADWLAKRLSRE